MINIGSNYNRPGRSTLGTASLSWVETNLPSARDIVEATYDPAVGHFAGFPAIGASYVSSTDGITWVNKSYGGSGTASSVAIGSGSTVGTWLLCTGVKTDKYLRSVNNGNSWGLGIVGTLIPNSVDQIIWSSQGMFYSMGDGGLVISSSDGAPANWGSATLPGAIVNGQCGAGNFRVTACSQNVGAIYVKLGDAWASHSVMSITGGTVYQSLFFGGGLWILCGSPTHVSRDLSNWVKISGSDGVTTYRAAYGDNTYVIPVHNSNYCLVSHDGALWSTSTLPSTAEWRAVAYGSGKFVVMAEGPTTLVEVGTVNV